MSWGTAYRTIYELDICIADVNEMNRGLPSRLQEVVRKLTIKMLIGASR